MTIDGFGIQHTTDCPGPRWRTTRARNGGEHFQRCVACGVTWRPNRTEEYRRDISDRFDIPLDLLKGNTRKEIQEYAIELIVFAYTPTDYHHQEQP